jgi:hypothetical protein
MNWALSSPTANCSTCTCIALSEETRAEGPPQPERPDAWLVPNRSERPDAHSLALCRSQTNGGVRTQFAFTLTMFRAFPGIGALRITTTLAIFVWPAIRVTGAASITRYTYLSFARSTGLATRNAEAQFPPKARRRRPPACTFLGRMPNRPYLR